MLGPPESSRLLDNNGERLKLTGVASVTGSDDESCVDVRKSVRLSKLKRIFS